MADSTNADGKSKWRLEGRKLGFPRAAGSFFKTPPTPEATGAGMDTEHLMPPGR